MSKAPHVTIRMTPPHYTMHCALCGVEHVLHTPCGIDMALAQMEAFGDIHKDCKSDEEEGETSD